MLTRVSRPARGGRLAGMWTWIAVVVIGLAVLALLGWIGNRHRRGERPGDHGPRRTSSRATGTANTYHKDL